MTHTVRWLDSGREPRCPPNPAWPNGIDIPAVQAGLFCKVALPYPARRCGTYFISCDKCGTTIGVTTAGRPDDPRSVEINCRLEHKS
jgi:hypothetical protein